MKTGKGSDEAPFGRPRRCGERSVKAGAGAVAAQDVPDYGTVAAQPPRIRLPQHTGSHEAML